MERVLEKFFAETPHRLSSMQEAVTEEDAARLEHFAHALRGTCRTLGASGMAGFCENLEKRASEQKLENAAALLESLEKEYELVKAEFEAGAWKS